MKTITKREAIPLHLLRRQRVAAYARVSSGKDAMLESLSAQISYYSDYIQQRIEWEFAGVYADEITGTKSNRAEFQRLLADCRAGKVDMVVVKSITRFARNTVTTLETVRELKLLGIDVFFEKENIHSISGDGELMLSLLASYAQEESRNVSENCKWRIRKDFAEGKSTYARLLGYRWVAGTFVVIPEEAVIVRAIFADYLDGLGLYAILKRCRRVGLKFSKTGLHNLLRNEKYAGDLLLQKTFREDHLTKRKLENTGQLPQYYIKDAHEAIIDRATFDAVQAEMVRRAEIHTRKALGKAHLFTGLIRCGICGASFHYKMDGAGIKYKKPTWMCPTFEFLGKEFCPSQKIPEDILKAKAAEVLGLPAFDETIFRAQICGIQVPAHNHLVFLFQDGHTVETAWRHISRRESWTPEMKQAARERALRQHQERSASP